MPPNPVAAKGNGPLVLLLAVALVTASLWAAREILLPLALGIILAFTLTPLVRMFDRLRLPRPAGVALTMLLALGSVAGIGYVIAEQFTDLSVQVTRYTSSMREKAADLRISNNSAFRQFSRAVEKVTEQLDSNAAELREAQPVRVIPSRLTPVERLRETATAFFEPVASAVIVLVLVVFMLTQREDLRDRIIRLLGTGNVTLTTRLLDEAAQRVSRFLAAQTLINICLGALVAGGLYWIGVPYAALWGGLAAVMRFVPYVGTLLSALLPAAMAFAIFPGWTETLQTLALFLALDFVAGYFVEPLLFGRRTGVSSFALLVSALYWIWIWGPVGLLLSTPLTVCIAVLGRHVRSLRFLGILFTDQPVLQPYVRYYQRLLARDEDEANVLASRQLAQRGAAGVMDQVLIPALQLAEEHLAQNEIAADDIEFVREATSEIVSQIRGKQGPAKAGPDILLCGPHGGTDQVVLDMVSVLLETAGRPVVLDDDRSIATKLTQLAAQSMPLICIVAASPGSGSAARNCCRRIRAAHRDARLLVLRPLPDTADATRTTERMKDAGADYVALTVAQAMRQVEEIVTESAARPPAPLSRLAT